MLVDKVREEAKPDFIERPLLARPMERWCDATHTRTPRIVFQPAAQFARFFRSLCS